MARKRTPASVEADVLVSSRRRCALCWGLNRDLSIKPGQIAHLDHDHSNSARENLAFFCLEHHDAYDTRRSQSKGYTLAEIKSYRAELEAMLAQQQTEMVFPLEDTVTEDALRLVEVMCSESQSGHRFDPQIRLSELPEKLGLSENGIEEAVDELRDAGYVDLNGTKQVVFPTTRLFWTFDPLFGEHDPARDALVVAQHLVEAGTRVRSRDLQERLSWAPRRLNPAINFLVDNELAKGRPGLGSAPYSYAECAATVKTRRYLKSGYH